MQKQERLVWKREKQNISPAKKTKRWMDKMHFSCKSNHLHNCVDYCDGDLQNKPCSCDQVYWRHSNLWVATPPAAHERIKLEKWINFKSHSGILIHNKRELVEIANLMMKTVILISEHNRSANLMMMIKILVSGHELCSKPHSQHSQPYFHQHQQQHVA